MPCPPRQLLLFALGPLTHSIFLLVLRAARPRVLLALTLRLRLALRLGLPRALRLALNLVRAVMGRLRTLLRLSLLAAWLPPRPGRLLACLLQRRWGLRRCRVLASICRLRCRLLRGGGWGRRGRWGAGVGRLGLARRRRRWRRGRWRAGVGRLGLARRRRRRRGVSARVCLTNAADGNEG